MNILTAILLSLLCVLGPIYVVWTLYLAIMSLASAKAADKLPAWAYRLAMPILGIGYLSDFTLNMTVASLLFLEVPRELLVTGRLSRHIKTESGWRKALATWICRNMLDFADPKGCHCR